MNEHIVELTQTGWSANHPVGCGDLMACPVTLACMALDAAPKIGRYFAEAQGNFLALSDGKVPLEIQGTSRRTSHRFTARPNERRPGG
jgi:hypothetical protein